MCVLCSDAIVLIVLLERVLWPVVAELQRHYLGLLVRQLLFGGVRREQLSSFVVILSGVSLSVIFSHLSPKAMFTMYLQYVGVYAYFFGDVCLLLAYVFSTLQQRDKTDTSGKPLSGLATAQQTVFVGAGL